MQAADCNCCWCAGGKAGQYNGGRLTGPDHVLLKACGALDKVSRDLIVALYDLATLFGGLKARQKPKLAKLIVLLECVAQAEPCPVRACQLSLDALRTAPYLRCSVLRCHVR